MQEKAKAPVCPAGGHGAGGTLGGAPREGVVTAAHRRPLFGALIARRENGGVTSTSPLTSERTWPPAGM